MTTSGSSERRHQPGESATYTILHTEYADGWGGQEMRIVSEARALAARGHRLLIAARPEAQILLRAERAGLTAVRLPMRGNLDPLAIARLIALLRRERVDILNTHSSIDAWIGGLAARLTGTVLVRTRHVSKRVRAHPFNAVHRWPAMTITTGEALRRQFIADVGLPPARVISIPTGVDLEHFAIRGADARAALRGQLGLPDNAQIVATIAVLRRAKRHALLLQVAARLCTDPDVYFVFAGEGSQRQPLEAEIARLGLQGRVLLLGHCEDVRPVIAGADVIVSASSGMEGVPQALLQAMAMERPVVATADGAIAEIVRDHDTGLLVPAEDVDRLAAAVERMLTDGRQASACARAGRALVATQYSLTAMTDAVEQVYAQLMLAIPPKLP